MAKVHRDQEEPQPSVVSAAAISVFLTLALGSLEARCMGSNAGVIVDWRHWDRYSASQTDETSENGYYLFGREKKGPAVMAVWVCEKVHPEEEILISLKSLRVLGEVLCAMRHLAMYLCSPSPLFNEPFLGMFCVS